MQQAVLRTVGTIFEGSKIPLGKWMMAVYLFSAGKNGASAHELHRDLGITYKSAWFMVQRIREAMAHVPTDGLLGYTVSLDETFIGGRAKNRHAAARQATYWGGKSGGDKVPVMSIVDAENGAVRSTVLGGVAPTTGAVLDHLRDHTDRRMTTMHTDEGQHYRGAAFLMAGHHSVNHSHGEYVNDKSIGTNQVENYFSQLKRSLDGTYHCVSPEHLSRYVGEFDYRASTRKVDDGTRSAAIVDRAYGRRLTYAGLIATGPVAAGTRRRPPGRPGPRR